MPVLLALGDTVLTIDGKTVNDHQQAFAAIGAVYSTHPVVPGDPVLDAVAKIAALAPVIVLVNVTWLAFGSLFSRWLSHPVLGRAVNVIFAVLLVASVAAAIL